MKPFNLEEAKAGKPVQTRDGRDARIICFDAKCHDNPIICLVKNRDCEIEEMHQYLLDGSWVKSNVSGYDLFMKTETKEGWVAVLTGGKTSKICQTKEIAESVGGT